jgi:hypothetical protein
MRTELASRLRLNFLQVHALIVIKGSKWKKLGCKIEPAIVGPESAHTAMHMCTWGEGSNNSSNKK